MSGLDSIFDGIRPYYDSEISDSAARLQTFEYLNDIAAFLKIEGGGDTLRTALSKCATIDDFQDKIMVLVVEHILSRTSAGLEYSGLEYFGGNKKYLILANHRDIVLDSAIIQLIFHQHKISTTEIAVGDNLITSKFIEDVARSNKMIKVTRSSSPREVYNSSMLLSKYIRHQIVSGNSSIWIAQRNGRTKDGLDLTEQGLLKMIQMSGGGDFEADMIQLNILPAAISYEFEPCDALKCREIFITRRHSYSKQDGEDLNSILTGMKSWKGRISIVFTEPILPHEVSYCSTFSKNERFLELGKIIDKQIHAAYRLWPNNYIAEDVLLNRSNKPCAYENKYSAEEKSRFVLYMAEQIESILPELLKHKEIDLSDSEAIYKELEDIFLHIYANPVKVSSR